MASAAKSGRLSPSSLSHWSSARGLAGQEGVQMVGGGGGWWAGARAGGWACTCLKSPVPSRAQQRGGRTVPRRAQCRAVQHDRSEVPGQREVVLAAAL